MSTRRSRGAALGAAMLLAAAMTAATGASRAHAGGTAVTVTVNAREGLATVPATGLGVNDAVWDSQLGTTAVSDLLGAAGVQMIRYPGGSYGDIYHWQDNTAPGGFVAPNTDFDTFMGSVRRIGAQPIIIANYGTGSPEEAAAWVQFANVTRGYGAKYWEVGNEIYGNGHYGANWEADNRADKSPTAYANEVVAYADAMKAVDPGIKVGAVLTMPAAWPDALVGGGDSGTWNQTVLSIAGSHIDFVDVHWYPTGSSAADILAKPNQITDAIYLLRQQIARFAGSDSARLGIALTETSSVIGRDTQPGALYLADAVTGLLENGVFTVDWWDVHNGIGDVSTVAGQTDFTDFGLLSSAGCTAGGTCEPALNTPFAPYFAIQMLSTFAHPGDQLVRTGTDQPMVSAHAVRRPNGDAAVLLVNRDPVNSIPVTIDWAGIGLSPAAPTVTSFTNGATALSSGPAGTATSQTLPPYSLTTVVAHTTASASAPPAPGQPSATTVTDRGATLSWRAIGSADPNLKYEIRLQDGTATQQWGETQGTSFSVQNLLPGTRYTVNVLARDGAGNLSWASPPLTFTTAAPAAGSCSVHFADTSDWASGFVGSLDITNNAINPVNGWRLDFTWPTGWQQLGSGWNGTWSQTGATVHVTNADFNATLAAGGGRANVGFVGNYSGPNVLPVMFTLNGAVCATL
jgi:Cellulose binding domain/Fibronectin type III domain